MNEFWDFEDYSKPKYVGLRDYHLRSALTSDSITLESLPSWDKNMIFQVRLLENNHNLCTRDPCKILGLILEGSPKVPVYGKEFYFAGVTLAAECKAYQSLEVPLLQRASDLLKSGKIFSKYFMPSQFFQSAIIISNAKQAKKPLPENITVSLSDEELGVVTRVLNPLNITLKISSECFGVILSDNLMSIHHIDHLKNWSDKCTERFNIELACIFGNPLNHIMYPPIESLYEFWLTWDYHLKSKGNKIYKCVKIFESLVIGIILSKNPNNVITPIHNFLKVTIQDFRTSLISEDKDLEECLNGMLKFLEKQESMQYLAQFYGLYRTWGHPIVSPIKGIQKVYEIGTLQKNISTLLPIQVRRIFMLKYAIWHKSTRGQYPQIIESTSNITNLNSVLSLISSNVSITRLEQTMNLPEWDYIKFKKCIEIPKTYNLSEMVADKAISPDRDSLYRICKQATGMYDANTRRGVLQWLLRESESCYEFLTRVNEDGLSENELIIGLYQKEREVNQTPRMFALMSHSIRNYIVTTESMLSDDILPAFPNITMTNSLLSLQKKIFSVSHKQSMNIKSQRFCTFKDITVIINIDFEKWNLNFRKETTYPIFEALGELYGLEHLYNRTYDIFSKSLIYLADGTFLPKLDMHEGKFILSPPTAYIGHLGGFEGLRQKGWTIFTDCALELVCSRHKCKHSIMGQGDNQVLILTWRTYLLDENRDVSFIGRQRLTKQFSEFMYDLSSTFEDLGLPVKALETWSSEHLFLYGKFPTLKGVPLAMSLKKICRAYYLANEEIMTLDCSLSAIQSNAMAACMSDVTSFVPYVVYKIQIFLALSAFSEYHVLLGTKAFDFKSGDMWKFTTSSGTRRQYKLNRPIQKWKFLIFLTWFYKILGGVNIATWYDFLMRGFPDRASLALTWISNIIKVLSDSELKNALLNVYKCHINPEKNFVLLVEDPCSLNLCVPVDARASVKQAVQELFENLTDIKNKEFASLFKFNKNWDKESFCNKLCEADILHPRFLHDIASATLGGYVDSIVSKVCRASTINKLALKTSIRSPGLIIEKHERNYLAYLLWKTESNIETSDINQVCPTQQVRQLRLVSWGKVLEGVNVPYPLAFLELRPCLDRRKNAKPCDQNYISIALPESFSLGNLDKLHELGNAPPYLGSETKEKLGADPARQVFGREPLISRPLKLLRVINWFVKPNSIAQKVIYRLLESISDLNPSEYVSREMGVTGSESHRYRDQALKHGVMSANMYTIGSHMHISTDPWVKYTRGIDNFPINYQAVLCSLQALIGGHLFNCKDQNIIPIREYHFHESCPECIIPLSDDFHDFISEEVIDKIPSGKENSYLWVQEASLVLKYQHDPQLILKIPEIHYEEYLNMENKRSILTQWIAEDVKMDIESSHSGGSILRLLDSRDYPRVMYKKLAVKELWEECANILIARAGVKYSSLSETRLTYPKNARELAADDVMKASQSSMLGLAMFYTWPDKFSEIYNYDNGSLFPDSNPPTLGDSCAAMQANLRDIIRKCSFYVPNMLILSRSNKYPVETIKQYWYRHLCIKSTCCALCLKIITSLSLDESLSLTLNLKCSQGHLVIAGSMKNIKMLTASEDKLLKDSIPFTVSSQMIKCLSNIIECPAIVEVDYAHEDILKETISEPLQMIKKSSVWQYSCSLPTNTKCRVYETLSILKFKLNYKPPSEGVIFGDGLGESSKILSHVYPSTDWIVSSLQLSEEAAPHSYTHCLIPCNPVPNINVDYITTKQVYNDARNSRFVDDWSDIVRGGMCWVEIETKSDRILIFSNILRLSAWDIIIIRSDFESLDEAELMISIMKQNSVSTKVYLCGSMDIEKYECVIVSTHTKRLKGDLRRYPKITMSNSFCESFLSINEIIKGMSYAEYLSSIEEEDEIVRMLKRCDYWFSLVGITHLLACTRLFTPVWWDLQTGKIPAAIKDLGTNKAYFMYMSDLISLQARLVCLSLSCLQDKNTYEEELRKYRYWKLNIYLQGSKIDFSLCRCSTPTNYGADTDDILKYLSILRKLNATKKRLWEYMPDIINFHTNMSVPGFWVSKLSQLTPTYLPAFQ
ncbi:TPA_asm: L [Gymnadenia densiflora virus 1]|uniref:RNA-directed RNA polymerase n=1 Tax=Gymnadenia densiflora virus 1 TaxID=3070916 RepID=A0A8D9PH35_9RHAB|nr:L [Gymnadenia densiflora virus 1] [Gymnadenia densiflora virus 1]DAF42331.1 TPA_asm: L [Gymnadenia densiflora virus 1]